MVSEGRTTTEILTQSLSVVALAGFLFIAPELANLAVEWIGDLAASLWLPSDRLDKPPLNYRLVEFYLKKERLGDALRELEIIVHHYPDEERAYRELIALAERAGDKSLRKKWERRWLRRFRQSPQAR